jgi:hypothetical protein
LKFIREDKTAGKVTGLSVWADDDDPYRFDTEDDFDENSLTLERMGYKCYYFGNGDDGAMKTNKTTVEIDGDKFNFYFEKSGGNKGAGKTGDKDDKFYQSGKLLRAGSDEKYQVVEKLTQATLDDTGKAGSGTIEGYNKLDDVKEFLEAITPANYSEGVTEANVKLLKGLGVNKDASDLSELYIINYDRKDAAGKREADAISASDYFLVNTSGKVIDTNSKNKDGNDYYYVVQKNGKTGKIVAVYVED